MRTKRQIKGTMTFGDFEGMQSATFAHRRIGQPVQLSAGEPGDGRSRDALPHRIRRARWTPVHLRGHEVHAEGWRRRSTRTSRSFCRTTPRCTATFTNRWRAERLRETGTAYLKFRTFEDLAAVGSLAAFLASFQVTGTNDPVIQLQARMRFIAFTAQFVEREYDPLAFA